MSSSRGGSWSLIGVALMCLASFAAHAAGGAPALTAAWSALPNPNVSPPTGPGGRTWTEMTWDPVRQQIVVFGGNGPEQYDNDIWSLDLATSNWTLLAPYAFCPGNDGFTQPNGTDDSAFKYDPVNNLYWVFGSNSGYRCISDATVRTAGTGSGPTTVVDNTLTSQVNDFYAGWTVVSDLGNALVQTYSASKKTLTLASPIASFGKGQSYRLIASTTAGTWYFDAAHNKWVGQDTPPGNTGPTPYTGRIAPGVAYSSTDRAMALFAGWSGDKQVWRLDLATKAWTQLPLPPQTPPNMFELLNAFVYDPANDVFVLFGGTCGYDDVCPDGTLNGDTWAYRLATNTWQKMNPANPPAARSKHLMSYDPQFGVIVLFGGQLANGQLASDTWYYHYPSNSWTRVNPSLNPGARYLSQIAYDPVGKRTVVFGGTDSTGSSLDDLWSLALGSGSNTPPTVSLTSPSSGSVFAAPASIGLAATASDPGGSVSKVQFFAGATKIGEDPSSPYGITWNVGVPGAYALTAVAIDNLGASTTSAPINVTVTDATPPTVAITSPASGATVSATINVTASATDNVGVAGVQLLLDGANLGTELTASPYTISWNTTTAADGAHALSARARDAAGNQTTSATVSVSVANAVDTTPPTITSFSPANGATGVNRSMSVTATFSEAMNAGTINTATFLMMDRSNTVVPATVTYSSSTRKATLNPTITLSTKSTYTMTIKGGSAGVKDAAGNPLASDAVWSFTTK